MPNYLTKEEIRQWRSSLEKITLEEFAARLGITVEETKKIWRKGPEEVVVEDKGEGEVEQLVLL